MPLSNHQTEKVKSVKVSVPKLTVSHLAVVIVELLLVRFCTQVRPGASGSDTVSPSLSLTMRMSFNVGKCGHSLPVEHFNEPH